MLTDQTYPLNDTLRTHQRSPEQQVAYLQAELEGERAARAQAEQRLRVAEARLRAFTEHTAAYQGEQFVQSAMDSLSAHIAVLDDAGTIIAVNEAWRAFAQSNALDDSLLAEGANYLAVCDSATGDDAEEAALFAAGIRAVLANDQSHFALEYPCHAPDEQRWFIGDVTRFVSNGRTFVVIAHENITSRVQAEIALRESEARFRTLVETIPTSVFIQDRFHISYMNPAAEAMFGYSWYEMQTAVNFWQIMHPDSHELIREQTQALLDGAYGHARHEVKIVPKDAQERWLDTIVSPVVFDGRESLLTVAVDITEHKRVAELRQAAYAQQEAVNRYLDYSRNLLHTLVDAINDGVALLNHEGAILAANQAMSRLLARSPNQLIGQPWAAFCEPPGQSEHAPGGFPGLWVLDTFHAGCPQGRREHLCSADGMTRVLDMQAVPIVASGEPGSEQWRVDQVVLYVADVTERVQMEEIMIQNERAAASRKISELVAHQVNTPLQTILASLEMMAETSEEERSDFLARAQAQIERIRRILYELEERYRHKPGPHYRPSDGGGRR